MIVRQPCSTHLPPGQTEYFHLTQQRLGKNTDDDHHKRKNTGLET